MFNRILKRGHKNSSHSSSSSTNNTISSPRQPSQTTLEILPLFCNVPLQDRPALFSKKVQLCLSQFSFTETTKFFQEKERKLQCLMDLVDFIQSGVRLTESNQQELVNMFSVNLFRPLLPSVREKILFSVDGDEESYLDPSWPHLQLVYELLLRYIVSTEMEIKVAKKYIDHSFVFRIIELFESEDRREREYLKTVLHRIYGKFMVHRPFIRKTINDVFYRVVYEDERHSGIVELLEIFGSIINGYALPMKEEHKLFLVRVLLPMHKPKGFADYHQHLAYCIMRFVEKDFKLVDPIVRGLLKFWPVTNCQKEVLFIGELQEVLENTREPEFQKCMVPLFKRIAKCITSSHYQVAERAMLLWSNDRIVRLIAQNRSVILPIVFEALEKNILSHWNPAVRDLTIRVRKVFLEMDVELFEECQMQYEEKLARAQELEEYRELSWQRLEMAVADQMLRGLT